MTKPYDDKTKQRILQELASSGESLSAFSKRVGISDSSLSRWRKDIHQREEFLEVGVPGVHYEIERNGVTLRVPATERLDRVVALIEKLSC